MEPPIWGGERVDSTLADAALALWERLPRARRETTRLAVGFSALGWPVDLAFFGQGALAVVQFVSADGPVTASRTGRWHAGDAPVGAEGPNPLLRLRLARLTLLDRLAERSPAVLGRAGDALVWDRAAGFVAVLPVLPSGSQVALGVHPRDCRVVGFDRLADELVRLRPTQAPMSAATLDQVLGDGLGLRPLGTTSASPGCFLCTVANRRCDLHRLRGSVVRVTGRQRDRLTVQTEDYWTVPLYLNKPWAALGSGIARLLEAGARPTIVAHHLAVRSHEGRVAFAVGEDGLVIVAPEVLVDVTAVAEMARCPLAYVVHQFEPKAPNAGSVRGKVVHAALRRLVRGEPAEEALDGALRESHLDLAFADLSPKQVRDDAHQHVSRVAKFIDGRSGQTETAVSNLLLGLAGRVDALWERNGHVDRLLELKTGRPLSRQSPRPNHRLQVLLYAASLWQAGRLDLARAAVEIVYTGGDKPLALATPADWRTIREALVVRNEAVLFDLTGMPLGAVNRCRSCPAFLRANCQFYADLLGYAPSMTTDVADRQTFRRWVAALRREAAHEARSQLGAARRSVLERVEDGSCFRIDTVDQQGVDDEGRWRARLLGHNISRFRPADRALLADDDPLGRQVTAEIEAVTSEAIDVVADAPAPWATRLEQAASSNLLQGVFQGLTGWLRSDERLRRLVAGERRPTFRPLPPPDPDLDRSQQEAAARALAAEGYALIWGPPGTGKTRTIARIVRALRGRTLLAAFTNQAVDNLALALLADGQESLLILGRRNRSHPALERFTLDAIRDDLDRARSTLAETPVVLTTAHQVANGRYDRALGGTPSFELVILDEATQLTEPAALGVLRLGRAFVLVGDQKQLAPIVADASSELARSLFERLWDHPASEEARVKLTRQYRMRAAIAAFSVSRWYDGNLETAPSAEAQPPILLPGSRWPALWSDQPAVFAAIAADHEAEVVATLTREALEAGLQPDQLGIVAPYRQQVAAIAGRLADLPRPPVIDTVDRFQGSERDCIILATGADRRGDLLTDERRLNVALTRAKRKLLVVGDPHLLRRFEATAALVGHFAAAGTLVEVEPSR